MTALNNRKYLPPFFVCDGNDVSIHASMEEMLRFLEPIDVKNKIYKTYDSEGRRIKLEMCGKKIVASIDASDSSVSDELKGSLKKHLKALNATIACDNLSLNQLIDVIMEQEEEREEEQSSSSERFIRWLLLSLGATVIVVMICSYFFANKR